MKIIIQLLFLFSVMLLFSQENGKWDSNSIQSRKITLSAGQSQNLSITLPRGTTKVFYTIRAMKLLGETEELSLISNELSKNPAPNFALLATSMANSAISMSDAKISYSIISQSDNNTYECFVSQGNVTNERVYLDYTNKNCLDISGGNLKLNFNFKSQNKFFGLRLVFEIVSFIDDELKNGWSKNIKNSLYENIVQTIKENNEDFKIENVEKFSGCIINKIVEMYSYEKFNLLADFEKQSLFENLFSKCRN